MTNGIRMLVESHVYDDQVSVKFEDEYRGVVVHVSADTLHDAMELAIARFKEMQDGAIEELRKYGLVRFEESKQAAPKGEPS